jgi:hypothetical protein
MKFRVYRKENPRDFKIIDVPDDYIRRRGSSQMPIKDYACREGFFSWADYEGLRARREP